MKTLVEIMGRIAIPLVLPFRSNEDVNPDALGELIDFVIARNYCDCLILTGTTGEFYALTDDERVEVWRVAQQAIGSRVPMVAGVGAASTRGTMQLAQKAEQLGCDILMVVVPYYSKPTQEGLLDHFRKVARSVSLPLLIYNTPLFTGVNLEPETLERLLDIPNIRGIKDEAGFHPTQTTAFALCTPTDFSIYCGDDTMVLQVLPQRGAGVVSGGSQVVGDQMRALIAAYFRGDNAQASCIHFRLAPFFAALSQNGRINPVPILRGAIEMVSGIRIGPPRAPQMPATQDELGLVRAVLEELGKNI